MQLVIIHYMVLKILAESHRLGVPLQLMVSVNIILQLEWHILRILTRLLHHYLHYDYLSNSIWPRLSSDLARSKRESNEQLTCLVYQIFLCGTGFTHCAQISVVCVRYICLCFHCLVLHVHAMLYYCDMVRWACLDWDLSGWLTTILQCFNTVGWVVRPV